jgi:hypothetical protein
VSDLETWVPLKSSGLYARVLRVDRVEVAFFKHLFESYEEVGIVRTVETRSDGTVAIAVLVPMDYTAVAAGILADVADRGAPRFDPEPLPPVCTEDWFLEAWTRER